MRLIGKLDQRKDASRIAAFLITQGVACKAEEEDGGWELWIIDENNVDRARDELALYRADPENAKYQNLEAKAGSVLKQEQEKRASSQRNMVDVRRKWARPARGSAPFVMTLIGLCVVVGFVTRLGNPRPETLGSRTMRHLYYADPAVFVGNNPLVNIKQGQVWRLITPIFLHFHAIHLAFNMFWLFQLGRLLEWRIGAQRLALLILVTAVLSNTAQAFAPAAWEFLGSGVRFGGMSGVVYGLFGYAWIRGRNDPQAGFMIPPSTVFIMLAWLVMCFGMANIANMAHLGGLICGMAAANVLR